MIAGAGTGSRSAPGGANRRMQAWRVGQPGPLDSAPLVLSELDIPVPADDELLIPVGVWGVGRTDVHLVLGELSPRHPGVVPGHQIIGRVVTVGENVRRFRIGDRVGVGWVHRTCGVCEACRRGEENLCPQATFTGWDVHGGFAEYAAVPDAFAHAVPADLDPVRVALLLCSGIIGYRALKRAALPPGGRLGIWGFGGSAPLAAQVALAQGAEVYVMTRGEKARDLARGLGAAFVGGPADPPPAPLDSA